MTIKISGLDVLIDDDMAESILSYKWHVQSRHRGIYFATSITEKGGRKKTVFLHRFVLGNPPGKMIDHRDGNHFDNRRKNLRICRNAENARNSKLFVTNTSGYKGVTKRGNKWEANIKFNGRHKYLGRFNSRRMRPWHIMIRQKNSLENFTGRQINEQTPF
jgi:hypothetical protein